MVDDHELVNAKTRIRGQLESPIETAEGIGHKLLRQHLLALRIVDLDGEGLVGKVRGLGLVVAGSGHPELEPHRLAGPIDGAIGNRVNPDLVINLVKGMASPDGREPKMGESSSRRPGDAEPLVLPLGISQVVGGNEHLAEVVGAERQILGLDPELVLAINLDHPPAEELDIGPGYRLARAGIGDEVIGFVRHHLGDDHRVVEADHDVAGVAAVHAGCQ